METTRIVPALKAGYYKDKYTENRRCPELCNCNATKGNAVNRLKQLTDAVIQSNGDDGIANWVLQHFRRHSSAEQI